MPDTTEVKIDPETNTLIREGVPSIVNPFDLYAIEEALRLREKIEGTPSDPRHIITVWGVGYKFEP